MSTETTFLAVVPQPQFCCMRLGCEGDCQPSDAVGELVGGRAAKPRLTVIDGDLPKRQDLARR